MKPKSLLNTSPIRKTLLSYEHSTKFSQTFKGEVILTLQEKQKSIFQFILEG
jgi:hypothetical protein